jgi:hypothetical protein
LGVLKRDYDVLTCALGNCVLKKPDYIVARKFNAVPMDKKTEEDVIAFVLPSVVHPPRQVMAEWFKEHAGICWDMALSLLNMYSAKVVDRQGK